MGFQDRFDLPGEDIFPPDDEHFFDSPGNRQVPIGIKLSHIARAEPSVCIKDFGGRFGHAVVAPHDIGPTKLNFAVLSCREHRSAGVNNSRFDFRQRLANGAQL